MLILPRYTRRPQPIRSIDFRPAGASPDNRLISLHWAADRTGLSSGDPDPGGSAAQLVSSGPALASSGSARPIWTAAGGGHPAHWALGPNIYWDAPDKASFDFLHQMQSGYTFDWGPVWTAKFLVYLPLDMSSKTAWLFSSNDQSSANIGACVLIDGTFGPPAINGVVSTGTEVGCPIYDWLGSTQYNNPYSVITGRWSIYTMEICWGRKGYHARGWSNGLPSYPGAGNIFYNLVDGTLGGEPTASTSTYITRFFNAHSGTAGATGMKCAMFGFWGCILTPEEHRSYDKYIWERSGVNPTAQVISGGNAYDCLPSGVLYPNNEMVFEYTKLRDNVDFWCTGIAERRSVDLETLTPEKIIGSYGKRTGIGTGVPAAGLISLIDGVTWRISLEANSPMELAPTSETYTYKTFVQKSLDRMATWSTPVFIDGGYVSTNTACEGPMEKAPNGDLLFPVYDISEVAKCMVYDPLTNTASVRSTVSTSAYEMCFIPVPSRSEVIALYRKGSPGFGVWAKVSTNNGTTWGTEHQIADTGTGGRPSGKLLASGGIVYVCRGSAADNFRAWVLYCTPSNVTAGTYHTVGGIMRPDTAFGGLVGAMILEPTAGKIRLTIGTELSGLGTPYCEIRDGIYIDESLLAQY